MRKERGEEGEGERIEKGEVEREERESEVRTERRETNEKGRIETGLCSVEMGWYLLTSLCTSGVFLIALCKKHSPLAVSNEIDILPIQGRPVLVFLESCA